jgi:GNAT superfamily N-acetyltransferase
MITIRPIAASDEFAWREMWAGYCAFYKTGVPDGVTSATWQRFFDSSVPVNCLIAEVDGKPVGFVTYVLHPYTWGTNPMCYLEDLFVRDEARGRDVGHALISRLVETAKREGWDRVYWNTQASNARARRLYDRFTPADDFVRYRIDTRRPDSEKAS